MLATGTGFQSLGDGDGKAIMIALMSTDPMLHQGFREQIPPTLRALSGFSRGLHDCGHKLDDSPGALSPLARAMSAQRAVSALQSLSDRSEDIQ